MHKFSLPLSALLFALTITMAQAQPNTLTYSQLYAQTNPQPKSDIMPAPSRAPRTSVDREKVGVSNEAPATMMGTAQAIDGATIRIHDSARDVTARLIGVVAPPLTTPEGASARVALDTILRNQTLDCARKDRDRDGSLVMSCSFGGGRDLSEAMLFTGTALFSRNGTIDNDLAVRYRAAEETAQMRRNGLWAQVPATTAGAAPVAATAPLKAATPASTATPVSATAPTPVISLTGGPASSQDISPSNKSTDNGNFAFTAWLEALGLLGLLFGMLMLLDHRHTRRARLTHELDIHSDRQILAAALTGELAAARDICEARAALITNGGTPTWPRLRTYIYQAHAEQIGLLGAVLARQVASIYGQMADYGATNRGVSYGAEIDLTTPASVSRALVRLCGYIEITLEGLAEVEHTGEPYYPTEDAAEQRHASQIAQRSERRSSPLPQHALSQAPASVSSATKIALKRIGRFEISEADADNGDDDGQPMAMPKASTPPETPAAHVETEVAPATAPAQPRKSKNASAASVDLSGELPAEPTAVTPAVKQTVAQSPGAASRATRRAALQQKARAGSLFKAEQALAETNAALGVDDDETAESKTA